MDSDDKVLVPPNYSAGQWKDMDHRQRIMALDTWARTTPSNSVLTSIRDELIYYSSIRRQIGAMITAAGCSQHER